MATPAPMTHRKAGNAQVGLSYLFLIGFFAALFLQGLGYLKIDVVNECKEMVMLVLYFWFQRQRETGPEHSPTPSIAPNPTTPAQPAK